MNMREAIVVNGNTFALCLDIDPVMIPDLGDGMTDPCNQVVIDLMWDAESADADAVDTADMGAVDYIVVWSGTQESPRIECPQCGAIVPLSESAADDDETGDWVVCLNCM